MAYVYRHIRLDKNVPFYIGIGGDDNGNYTRAYSMKGRNVLWRRIVNITKYEVQIVLDDLTWGVACKKEIEFIKLYGRKDKNNGILSNMTDGGEGVSGFNIPEELRKVRSDNFTGSKNPFYNKRHSEETLIKMRIPKTEAHRDSLSKARIGKFNGEDNANWGNHKLAGKNHFFFGKKRTIEDRLKMSKNSSNKKAVLQYSKEGDFIAEYDSITSACVAVVGDTTCMVKTLKGYVGYKTVKGYIWKYK